MGLRGLACPKFVGDPPGPPPVSVLAVGTVRTDAGYRDVVWQLADGGTWSTTRLAGVGSAVDAAPINDRRYVVVGGDSYGKAWSAILTY